MVNKFVLKPHQFYLIAITSAFFLLTLVIALNRYYSFYSSYDQGTFNQMFWNTLQGYPAQSSLASGISSQVVHLKQVPMVNYSHFGMHFTPAMLLWLPLYFLFPSPATLSVIQVFWVTTGGIVLYFLARQHLNSGVSLWITASFYTAIATIGPTLSNFDNLCQLPVLIFSLLLAMEKRQWWLFAIFALWILAVREDAGIPLFSVGTYLILSRRYPGVGFLVCITSLLYMIVVTNLVMPQFADDISTRFMVERFGQYVNNESASTLEVIKGMLTQPLLLLEELVTPIGATLNYLLGHWLPLAFVPLLAPAGWLVAGFPLLTMLLAKGMTVLVVSVRYSMMVAPGFFYGTILWWRGQNWLNFWQPLSALKPRSLNRPFRFFWLFCLTLSLIFSILASPSEQMQAFYFLVPDSIQPRVHISLPEQWLHSTQIRGILEQIPPDASVAATNHLIPPLSGRRAIIRLPAYELVDDTGEKIKVDYLVADLWRLAQYQVAFTAFGEQLQNINVLIEEVTSNQEYGIVALNDGVILLQKGIESDPEALNAWLNNPMSKKLKSM
ncbi:DUF2079 domain-containing protein [Gloeocapsa sp. PCC 73106]|uniref:DUF2079 domain-containing protein n=1 Tax=Gloeocapsa sp. PCC 73106 TaxID=102232 RepID=UPI0002AD16F1|nr:DUF2079 domain-containing protein [Gloeocapsa sp. PCC 73106]ELR98343.1 putative membrane protein [Gloeocapsa sp. PCC 73106]